MPKLPVISGKKAVKTLENMGFVKSRQAGSYVVLKKSTINGNIFCVVPLQRKLKLGTFIKGCF